GTCGRHRPMQERGEKWPEKGPRFLLVGGPPGPSARPFLPVSALARILYEGKRDAFGQVQPALKGVSGELRRPA
ncbi:MAG: hypothetical protein WBF17_17435, partial [Phycisphaerae bacterium]